MVANFPGPYEVRIFYSTTPTSLPQMVHEQRLNVNVIGSPTPGTDFTAIQFLTRSGANVAANTAVLAWVALVAGLYNTNTEFVSAELWQYAPLSFEATYISTLAIADTGDSAVAPVAAGQLIYTFRTQEGGVMRLSFMETVISPATQQTAPYTPAAAQAINAFVLGTTNWVLARDTSYPIANIRLSPGQSEALFKRRFRQLS